MDENGQLFAVAPAGTLPSRMMSHEIRHSGVMYNTAAPIAQTGAFPPPTHYGGPGSVTFPGGPGTSMQQPAQPVSRMMMMRSSAYPAVTASSNVNSIVVQNQLPDELARTAQQAMPSQTYTNTLSSSSVTLSHSSPVTREERLSLTSMDTSVTNSALPAHHAAHTTAASESAASAQLPLSSLSALLQPSPAQQCVQPDEKSLPCSAMNSVSPVKNSIVLNQPLDRIDSTVVAGVGSVVKLEPKSETEVGEDTAFEPAMTGEHVKLEVKTEQPKQETELEAASEETTTDSKEHLLLGKEHLSPKPSDAAADDESACDTEVKKEPSRKGMD